MVFNLWRLSIFEAVYIGNNQHIFKKILDGHFSNLLRLLKNGQKSDSFASHFKQHFDYNVSHTDLCKYMMFKVVKQINYIGSMHISTKPS